jgi:hypothetical protein
MPQRILLEEIHLTLTVPASMTDAAREGARRLLNGREFRWALRKVVSGCLMKYSVLHRVRLMLAP